MSYSLSFSDEFYCDGDPYEMEPTHKKPTCLFQSILNYRREDPEGYIEALELAGIVKKGTSHEHLCDADMPAWDLMIYAKETVNTCSDLSNPVEVWLDPKGDHTVLVYDKAE